jgi:hypothetical protein
MALEKSVEWVLATDPAGAGEALRVALATMGAELKRVDAGSWTARTPRAISRNRWAADLAITIEAQGEKSLVTVTVMMTGSKHNAVLNELVKQLGAIVVSRTKPPSNWQAARAKGRARRAELEAKQKVKRQERGEAAVAKMREIAAVGGPEIHRSPAYRAVVTDARQAYGRGDHIFQYVAEVETVRGDVHFGLGATTQRQSHDHNVILNAIAKEGWELVDTSSAFREEQQKSRNRFLATGQNIAVRGAIVNTYTFKRRSEADSSSE